jgi:hypothetical protein
MIKRLTTVTNGHILGRSDLGIETMATVSEKWMIPITTYNQAQRGNVVNFSVPQVSRWGAFKEGVGDGAVIVGSRLNPFPSSLDAEADRLIAENGGLYQTADLSALLARDALYTAAGLRFFGAFAGPKTAEFLPRLGGFWFGGSVAQSYGSWSERYPNNPIAVSLQWARQLQVLGATAKILATLGLGLPTAYPWLAAALRTRWGTLGLTAGGIGLNQWAQWSQLNPYARLSLGANYSVPVGLLGNFFTATGFGRMLMGPFGLVPGVLGPTLGNNLLVSCGTGLAVYQGIQAWREGGLALPDYLVSLLGGWWGGRFGMQDFFAGQAFGTAIRQVITSQFSTLSLALRYSILQSLGRIDPNSLAAYVRINFFQNWQAIRFLLNGLRTPRALYEHLAFLERLSAQGKLTEVDIRQFALHLMTYYYEYDFIDGNIVRVPLARLYIDGPDVPPRFRLPDANTPGKTVVLEDGTVVITRSPDTTSYFALHEYIHMLHYRQLESIYGRSRAQEIWDSFSTREKEQAVYDTLRGVYWDQLTPEMQRHAAGYLIASGGFAW